MSIYIYIICTEGVKAWSPQVQTFGSLDNALQRLFYIYIYIYIVVTCRQMDYETQAIAVH